MEKMAPGGDKKIYSDRAANDWLDELNGSVKLLFVFLDFSLMNPFWAKPLLVGFLVNNHEALLNLIHSNIL